MTKIFAGAMLVIGALAFSTGHASAMTGSTLPALSGAAKADLQKVHDDEYFGRWRLRCDWDDYWCRQRYARWRDEGRDWWWGDRGRRWHWDTYRRPRHHHWRHYCEDPADWRCD